MARLQVMTWNVQNLFLPEHEGGPDTEGAFDEKLASLAGVIDRVAPDVAALQEIGPDVLGRLQAALTHRLPHGAVGDADDRGIRVALLSTRPLAAVGRIRLFPAGVRAVQAKDEVFDDPITANVDESMTLEMGRGALEATVDVDGVPVTVLTAHFKSKLITYARRQGIVGGSRFAPNDEGERLRYAGYAIFRRAGEAMTIRARLDQLLAEPTDPAAGSGRDRAVVFCGDLNDEPEAATTQIVAGPSGSQIELVPGSEIELKPGSGFTRPDQDDGFRLWNLAPLLPEGQRFTRVFKGRGELIDHIFASHRLVNPGNLPVVETVRNPAPLPSMGDDPSSRRNLAGSDHAAVCAAFDL
jgi:endonuclease/exonuclease/phosphatase family metal-dependent hydrolase